MAKPKSLPYEASENPEPFSVTLHSTVGGADKIYKLSIEAAGDQWLVNFANGKRTGALKPGTKTEGGPVSYDKARKILNDTLYSKVGSGYLPIGGSRFAEGMTAEAIAIVAAESSGYLPQLANAMDDVDDEIGFYLHREEWWAEEKHDGERRFVIVDADGIRGGNRTGKTVALPDMIAATARSLGHTFVLDGEQVGDVFYAFDIISLDGENLRGKPLYDRKPILEQLLQNAPGTAIRLVRHWISMLDKTELIDTVRNRGGEGVIFKNARSTYTVGKPPSEGDWIKLKNWNSLSAIVAARNNQRSVLLELFEDNGDKITVGNVTIPANVEQPYVGDVIEVRYLYAYDGGSLYQPAYLGKRSDISPEECLASQRRFVVSDNTDYAEPVKSPSV